MCFNKMPIYCRSIHLCNNAIQGNKENGIRSSELPDENMWYHTEFIDWLSARGAESAWSKIIYPGMKQAITAAMRCSQDIIESRKVNSLGPTFSAGSTFCILFASYGN